MRLYPAVHGCDGVGGGVLLRGLSRRVAVDRGSPLVMLMELKIPTLDSTY